MKIVHLVPSLVKGGAERAVVDIANWQVEKGHSVTVVAGTMVDERLLRHQLNECVEVIYITRSAGRLGRYIAGVAWLWQRRMWLADQDIVHAHMTFSALLLTAIYYWRRQLDVPKPRLFETYHAVGMPIRRISRWIHAQMAKRRDMLILMADDPYWADFQSANPQLPSRIILNGLAKQECVAREETTVQDYRRSAGIPDDCRLLVGSVGRLVSERRPELYIPIFAKLARSIGSDIHFLLAGAGPELKSLQGLIQEHQLEDRVHLPGLAVDPALPIALMDLYLTINIGAVTGLAAVQAAFCGVPLIGIQLNGSYKVRDDDWIWSSNDLQAVAEEALRLLRDAGARSDQAARQSTYARENLSIDRMARSYQALYDDDLATLR